MVPAFLSFVPLYQERVWGGRALADRLGRRLPQGGPIGESWEIVDRPEAQSVVADGAWRGRTLREVIAAHAAEVMGNGWAPERPFPILVKWLDCRERLSLQVHPPASIAAGLGGEPKTENWYIVHAEPGAGVLAGLKPGVDAARFRAALADGSAEGLVERHATRAGDSLLIRSGVMHAIDGGNVILEIQQNSDTTYRVYDWGRVGLDGRPRQLHLEQSLACLAANTAPAPRLAAAGGDDTVLAECAEFRLRRVRLAAGAALGLPHDGAPRIVSVAAGTLRAADGARVDAGANVLVPAAAAPGFLAAEAATVLVTERFAA
jgi:mannose-6-phosphate isomerase